MKRQFHYMVEDLENDAWWVELLQSVLNEADRVCRRYGLFNEWLAENGQD